MRLVLALRLISAVALFLAAMSLQLPAIAGTFNVSDAAGLRAALLTAGTNVEDDVIVLAAGTYATSGTAFTFVTNESKTLTLQGANGTTRDEVVLDGGGTSRVLGVECLGNCGAITLRGLTVRNGNATGAGANGGGVKASTALMLSDVSFSGNRSSSSGGAIYASVGAVTVTNSTFSNNTAFSGGAIYASLGVTLTNSLFSNNTASVNGGAIDGGGTVTNSTFNNNTATNGVGGAINGDGTVANSAFNNNTAGDVGGAINGNGTVNNSTFSNNSASGEGGAIGGGGTITNSTFSGNTAGTNGGAINAFASLIIANDTFSGNAAAGSGAAIYLSSTSSIINSVFFGHAKPAIYADSVYNLYNNLINTSTDIAGSAAIMVGNVAEGATSPFVDTANGNFRLATGSLAIDTGLDPNSTTFPNLLLGSDPAPIRQALLTDLDGNPRPTPGTAVDIGAYEFLPMPVFTSHSDCLFNWAERTYPNWFAPAGAISNTLAPYYYRHYLQTNAYLGTSSADNHVYYLGPLSNYAILDVGALSGWLSRAGCQ